jgi:hypothetical protein
MPVIDTCTIGTCLYRHRLLGQISTRPTRPTRLARLFGRNVYGSGKSHESRTKAARKPHETTGAALGTRKTSRSAELGQSCQRPRWKSEILER